MVKEMTLQETLAGINALIVDFMECDACLIYLTDGDELVAKVAPPAVEEEEVAAEEAPATPEVITETETQRRRTERDD